MAYESSCIQNATDTTQNEKYSLSYCEYNVYKPNLCMIHTKQPKKQTEPERAKQRHQRGFHHYHKIYTGTTETTKILEYS